MSYFEQPLLVTFTSIPGSGKSYFARQAAERMNAARLSSDALRGAIFGSLDAYYTDTERLGKARTLEYVFGAMDYAAEQLLTSGQEREELPDQRQKTEEGMRKLIERIQAGTDPFSKDEPVVSLDGMKPFGEQFVEFEAQVKEILGHGQ